MAKKKSTAKKKTASKKKTAAKKKAAGRSATKKKKAATKKKTATKKKAAAKKKTSTKKKSATKKKTSTKKKAAASASRTSTSTKKKKAATKKKAAATGPRKNVVPWSERFKDSPGPWTCPKCGPLSARVQPLYGEDEKHHCPNLDCDAIVTLLTPEDLEPAERRSSWPPQRNKGGRPGEPQAESSGTPSST